ncbi:MAG: hypothetical protein AB7D47_04335 [Desulfovibrio sp.]|jgi:hypothetical protein
MDQESRNKVQDNAVVDREPVERAGEQEFDVGFADNGLPDPAPAQDPEADSPREDSEVLNEPEQSEQPSDEAVTLPEKEPDVDSEQDADAPDLEELQRKADGYDSEQGRLRQAQEEIQRLRRELEVVQKEPEAPQGPDAPPVRKLEELPEGLREDVQTFQQRHPDVARLVLEQGHDGEHLRRVLEEFGPEHVLTLEVAERIREHRTLEADRRARQEEEETARRKAHYDAIFSAHPDYAALVRSGDKVRLDGFYSELDGWAASKPYGEGQRIVEALKQGTAPEVVEVLQQFKKERRTQAEQRRRKKDAEAGMVPSSRPSPPPRGRASKDDFEAGFDEGFGS